MTISTAYTRPSGSQSEVPEVRQSETIMEVRGYQNYTITKAQFNYLAPVHRIKFLTILSYLSCYDKNDQYIDIGCSAGALGLQLIFEGYGKVTFVDHDAEYAEIVGKSLEFIGANLARVHVSSVGTCCVKADVGIALALIHWIYSYSEKSGSLDEAVGMLKRLASRRLFIEWVSPDDPAVRAVNHIDQNRGSIREPYTLEAFRSALVKHYGAAQRIGRISETREIWYADATLMQPPIHRRVNFQIQIALLRLKNFTTGLRRRASGKNFEKN